MTKNERAALVPALKEKIAAFTDEMLGATFTARLEDPTRSYPSPEGKPADLAHPRVLLNAEMLPAIRAAFENPENAPAVAAYRAALESETDGSLPEPYLHETGRKGEHNFDYTVLAAIEARAMEYLLTGEEYYGYSAVLGIMNYLSTLRVKWIYCDQCREFGSAMYYTALVYDWCYDLLSEDDKRRLIAAVENRLCKGESEEPEKAIGRVKMEIGFPPTRQGCVTGHGSETQLLRDYVAFSIAIANEAPGWWEYVGARIENEFIPARQIYYAAGIYPQGMSCYAPARFPADLWSACLLKQVYGKNPWCDSDMKRTFRTMLAHETDEGRMFPSGDGASTVFRSSIGISAIFSSFLFDDGVARAVAMYFNSSESAFVPTHSTAVTATVFLLLSSRGTKTAPDRRAEIPLLHKTKGYANQFIARSSLENGSPTVLMRAGGRYTANHEHSCAGNFQVWYKGHLTGDTGMYQGYGSPQHSQFHVQSVAHNVPLVFNPEKRDRDLIYDENGRVTNLARYWYSGGQRRTGEAPNVDFWHGNQYIAGEPPIMQSKTEDGKAIYAYASTEITRAYEPDTVAYLRRTMLTSFMTDGSTPMALFVFDRIEAVDPGFKKSFLLQIQSPEAPVICGNTVTTANEDGQLTLTAVTPSILTGLGGEGQNYLVNGNQCAAPRTPGKTWGRVEISPIGEKKIDHMLNVMTVADRGAAAPAVTALDCGRGCVGAAVAGSAAIFRCSREDLGSDIAFTLPEAAYTYFSGLNEGEFAVTDEAENTVATLSVGENENLAAVALPAGKLLLRKL